MDAHEKKFEALAQAIGIDALRAALPVKASYIKEALAAGDHYLNTINLHLWDRAAGCVGNPNGKFWLSIQGPWYAEAAKRLSLAERVCVLKHVAKFHLEKETSDEGDTNKVSRPDNESRITNQSIG